MSQHCSHLIFNASFTPRTNNHTPRRARSIAPGSQCTRPLATDRRGLRLRLTICSSLSLIHTFNLPSFFYRHVYPAFVLSMPVIP
jgi:hypothetical protein